MEKRNPSLPKFVAGWKGGAESLFRPRVLLTLAFALLNFVSITVLGWHYASDAVGGILLSATAVWVGRRFGAKAAPLALRPGDSIGGEGT